jgi:hypothetical protein
MAASIKTDRRCDLLLHCSRRVVGRECRHRSPRVPKSPEPPAVVPDLHQPRGPPRPATSHGPRLRRGQARCARRLRRPLTSPAARERRLCGGALVSGDPGGIGTQAGRWRHVVGAHVRRGKGGGDATGAAVDRQEVGAPSRVVAARLIARAAPRSLVERRSPHSACGAPREHRASRRAAPRGTPAPAFDMNRGNRPWPAAPRLPSWSSNGDAAVGDAVHGLATPTGRHAIETRSCVFM